MTSGITTWDDLGRLGGNVLAILNSPLQDEHGVATLFDELERRVLAGRLHVIASPGWRDWLGARGVSGEGLLLTVDDGGGELELNHFLETPTAVLWITHKQFAFVVGAASYAVYNDEVKEIFERRLTVLLGSGRFLAHTLPNPYVFVLDLPAIVLRSYRKRTLERYTTTCRAMIDDLYRHWIDIGKPAVADDVVYCDVVEALGRHLGTELLAFDEAAPIPLPRPAAGPIFADIIISLQSVLREHDQRLADLTKAFRDLTALHAERVAAVNLRDSIIEDLRREHEPLTQRWRRWLRSGQ